MKLLRKLLMICVLASAAACGGDGETGSGSAPSVEGPSSPVGVLSLKLTDAPAAPTYQEVWITIERILIHRSELAADEEDGWYDMGNAGGMLPARVDLLSLRNGKLRSLGDVALPEGRYEQIRLVLGSRPGDNEAVVLRDDGSTERRPLSVPSGRQSGLKLVHAVDLSSTKATELVLDFDAARSLVEAGKSGRLLLSPVISVIATADSGEIDGVFEKGDLGPLKAASISVQKQDADGHPVVVRSTVVDADGRWRLSPVPAGKGYSLVVAGPGIKTMVVTDLELPAGASIRAPAFRPVQDFLPGSTVSGEVASDIARDAQVRALQQVSESVRVEVAFTKADAESGVYRLVLPKSPARVAPWRADFVDFRQGLSEGTYQIEASGGGSTTEVPEVVVSKSDQVDLRIELTAP